MSQHWSDYWSSGALTSLPQDFKQNYDGEVAAFWHDVLDKLPQQADILDVCTGNLALPLLFADYAKQRQWQITGVDRAVIDKTLLMERYPNWASTLAAIRLRDDTPVESLSEAFTEKFDLITSQYGLEYCDTAKTAAVVAGMLKPGGRLALVAHAADTAIVPTMQREFRAYEQLVELGVFHLLERFSEGGITAQKLARQLPVKRQVLATMQRQQHHVLLDDVQQALSGLARLPISALKQQRVNAGAFCRDHQQAHLRNRDVLQVSKKILKDPNWYQGFVDAGLQLLERGILRYQGRHNAGSYYVFIKPEVDNVDKHR